MAVRIEKKLWQLTFKEFARRQAARAILRIRRGIREGSTPRVRKELQAQFTPIIANIRANPEQSVKKQAHLNIVRNALKQGKPVPEIVLRDHDLGKKAIEVSPKEKPSSMGRRRRKKL